MTDTDLTFLPDRQRANWVRLQTLNTLRWVAIAGQSGAVLAATLGFGLSMPLRLVVLTVAALAIANISFSLIFPGNKRLTEREAFLMLLFDILQLGLLLYLTGGLNNPFALLLLAPVTIAATVLHPRSALALGLAAILIVAGLARWNVPLMTGLGVPMELPDLFRFGTWLSLTIGIAFMSIYARLVTQEMHAMSDALAATQMALAREQKLTDLGGVVAAAAHELGTPLATIKLVSSEMLDELDDEELREDARLIREQADRCRDILRSMGRAGKEDRHLRSAPFEAVVREAAEPHLDRNKTVRFTIAPSDGPGAEQPLIERRPEIVHGLRNLIQNAVDFARGAVEIRIGWSAATLSVWIVDDGPGFSSQVISRIGDPFVRFRRSPDQPKRRPGYEGMGLGLFIAKTLLERTGARLSFDNRTDGAGAIVTVTWPADRIVTTRPADLGENQPILP